MACVHERDARACGGERGYIRAIGVGRVDTAVAAFKKEVLRRAG